MFFVSFVLSFVLFINQSNRLLTANQVFLSNQPHSVYCPIKSDNIIEKKKIKTVDNQRNVIRDARVHRLLFLQML